MSNETQWKMCLKPTFQDESLEGRLFSGAKCLSNLQVRARSIQDEEDQCV